MKVGSVNENAKQAGMTHLIEHLCLKAPQHEQRMTFQMPSISDGEFNDNNMSVHFITCTSQRIPNTRHRNHSGIIKNPLFAAITKENVVLNEIKMVHDDPKAYRVVF